MPIQHAKAALRVGDLLCGKETDPSAHVTIHNAPNEWHSSEIVHPITEKKTGLSGRRGRCYKPIDFFGKMLAVGIENDDVSELSIQPVAQSGLDRFTFAAVLAVNNDFGASFTRPLYGLVV